MTHVMKAVTIMGPSRYESEEQLFYNLFTITNNSFSLNQRD